MRNGDRRIRVTFVGFESFWMDVAVRGLGARYSRELDCRWMLWPCTFRERLRFLRVLFTSDLVIRLGMPFEFQSETNRFFLVMLRLLPRLQAANYWIGEDLGRFLLRREAGELTARDERALRLLHHFAVTEHLRDILIGIGVPAVNAELMGPERPIPEQMPPLPAEFRVLSYWMDSRIESCGGLEVLEAARALPDVPFDIIGTTGECLADIPPNVTFHGFVSDVMSLIERAVVYVRLVQFDALPSSLVEESLLLGRQVIYSFEWPHTIHVPYGDAGGLITALQELLAQHRSGTLSLNAQGRAFTIQDSDADAQAKLMYGAIEGVVRSPKPRGER